MKFADRVKESTTATSAAAVTLGGALAGYRTLAKAIAAGASDAGAIKVGDTGVPFCIDDGAGKWELGLYTVTSAVQLTRTAILSSSADGAAVAFDMGAKSVTLTAPASYLGGTPIADYLAANDAGTPANTDLLPLARGSSLFGLALSALAAAVNKLWPGTVGAQATVNTTLAFPLDFSTHNRRRVVCLATPEKITAPTAFSSVGNGFECRIDNLSGADITLEGIVVRPSGSVLPNGASADVFAAGGSIYANLYGTATATGSTVQAPGQVTGLTAGTSTDTTQPLSWTAVSGAAGYKVEYKLSSASTWTTAASNATSTSYTVTGLTASSSYDYRVTASNSGGNGTASATVTKSTVAASSGGGGTAPFTASGTADFPTALGTYQGDSVFHALAATGSATIQSVAAAISTSNTQKPTQSLSLSGTGVKGLWLGNMAGGPTSWYISPALQIQQSLASTVFYLWIIITDSNGAVWCFVHADSTTIGDGVGRVSKGSIAPTVQVA